MQCVRNRASKVLFELFNGQLDTLAEVVDEAANVDAMSAVHICDVNRTGGCALLGE